MTTCSTSNAPVQSRSYYLWVCSQEAAAAVEVAVEVAVVVAAEIIQVCLTLC